MLFLRLNHFIAVADHGSIVRAADALRMAQPALSRQMLRLEKDVGVPLLERERRGVRLTPAGTRLLAGTKALFARMEQAVAHARQASEGDHSVVRIGLARIAVDSPRILLGLAAMRDAHPTIRLDIKEIGSTEQPAALHSGNVDVAIGAVDFGDGTIKQRFLFEESADSAVVSIAHPLAAASGAELRQLLDDCYLTLKTSLGAFPIVLGALRKEGLKRYEQHESVECLYSLVAAGKGWTIAPHSFRARPPAGTAVIPIMDFRVPVPISLGWSSKPSSATRKVVAVLLREIAGTADGLEPALKADATPPPVPSAAPVLQAEHLRALAAAIDAGSLSRAAAKLNLAQSVVSRRIQALERDVGVRLLERKPHGIVATQAGHALRLEVDGLLRLADDAMAAARASGVLSGTCTIGTLPPEITGRVLFHALKLAGDTMPNMALKVVEMDSEEQIRALREHRIDIGLASGFPGLIEDPAIASVLLVEDTLDCAILSASHALATRAWVTAGDLAGVPFLFLARDQAPRAYDTLMRAFARIGLAPTMAGSYSGARAMWGATFASNSWTVGFRTQRSTPPPGTVAIPLEGLNVPCGVMLLWRRDEAHVSVRRTLDLFRQARTPEPQTRAS